METRSAKYVRHPLGAVFAKWVAVTDSYRTHLTGATPEHLPNARRLMARLVRRLGRVARGASAGDWMEL